MDRCVALRPRSYLEFYYRAPGTNLCDSSACGNGQIWLTPT